MPADGFTLLCWGSGMRGRSMALDVRRRERVRLFRQWTRTVPQQRSPRVLQRTGGRLVVRRLGREGQRRLENPYVARIERVRLFFLIRRLSGSTAPAQLAAKFV